MLLVACAALILFARAGAGPLANFDDCYYAEKAKQMLRTGDWLTPRFAGVERLDNPPLFLWLMAGSFAALGVNAFAAVLWSALAGVACVALTYRLAQRLGLDAFESFVAAIVMLATGYFLKYANHAMFDVFMTALFLLALLAYRRAWEGEKPAWIAVGVISGLGVLTKSVLGLFPLVVIAAHVLWCGRAQRAWRTGAWWAPVALLAVLAPWYGFQLLAHRDAFVREHIAWLLFQRGTGTGASSGARWSPFGYVRELGVTYWPWLPAAAYGVWLAARESFAPSVVYTSASTLPREWKPRDSARLLFAWIVVVLGVLSAAHEQKLWYAMSVFPALALCAARAIGTWVTAERLRARVVTWGFGPAAARHPGAGRGGARDGTGRGRDRVRGRQLLRGREPVRVLQRPAAAARQGRAQPGPRRARSRAMGARGPRALRAPHGEGEVLPGRLSLPARRERRQLGAPPPRARDARRFRGALGGADHPLDGARLPFAAGGAGASISVA